MGEATDPEKITIYGDNFGTLPTNVRILLNGKQDSCKEAQWMPKNPPKFKKSYLQCTPDAGGTSGAKNITLEFSKDESFTDTSLLYKRDALVFSGFYSVKCSADEYEKLSNIGGGPECVKCPTRKDGDRSSARRVDNARPPLDSIRRSIQVSC